MRRTTPLALLSCAAVALGTGAAGMALAHGVGERGTLAAIGGATARTASPEQIPTPPGERRVITENPEQTWPAAAAMVTVPALTAGAPAPATEPPGTAAASAASAASTASTASTAAPALPEPAAPAPDTPATPSYSTVLGWHEDGNVAYLTFDDGPGPATARILDILAATGVKATFCQVGQKVRDNPALAQRVTAEGHTVCNHSWDHPSSFDALAPENLDQEIGLTQNAITAATGVTVRYFRAPEGRFGPPDGAVLRAAQRARTIPLGWGVDSLDWTKPGVPAIVTNVLTAVSPGAVILLHDGGGTDRDQTLEALPGIIAGLQAAGYTLAALPADPAG